MNLFSSDTLLYTPTPMDQPPHHFSKPFPFYHKNPDINTNTNTNTDTETTSSHEYMFEKPLTPSDVGKLNRLVIPKQHAEKYFPLASVASNGGVLLGFEDETGKCWKFRYSYWNSSQSYVLTKGWSRYVKDKKLDAGDVVLFQRHRFESDRLFIGWRRRGSTPVHHHGGGGPIQYNSSSSYRPNVSLHAGTEVRQGGGQKGIKSGVGNSKRVRLFGVNLECQIQEVEVEVEGEGEVVIEEPEIEMSQTISCGSPLSSHGQGQVYHAGSGFAVGPTEYNYFDYMGYSSNHHYNSHMDINFPQDVNQRSNSLR